VNASSVVVRSVTKTYRRGQKQITALEDVSFEMSQGELALFVGPSGSGKTTLLNLIAALDVPIVVKLSSTDLKSPACPAPLPQLLYLGLNEDEAERMVFDGVLVHIAGGKRGGDFNMRFGQPSASLPSDPFPFNEMGATDPISGRSDGLLVLWIKHMIHCC
jgi:energy-coupling factor transporter ATP-binding protein EcfA2